MTSFGSSIRPHVEAELQAAFAVEAAGDRMKAFAHLERAHILGQGSTREHVRVHWQMLRWALRQRSKREFLGQLFRLGGAATKTAVGLVPHGNTGGSSVSPIQPMPVPPDLDALIHAAKNASSRSGLA